MRRTPCLSCGKFRGGVGTQLQSLEERAPPFVLHPRYPPATHLFRPHTNHRPPAPQSVLQGRWSDQYAQGFSLTENIGRGTRRRVRSYDLYISRASWLVKNYHTLTIVSDSTSCNSDT